MVGELLDEELIILFFLMKLQDNLQNFISMFYIHRNKNYIQQKPH